MGYLQYICDIERAMLCTAGFIHELCVHVTCWGHDGNDALPLFIEKESGIADLGTWEQEVVHWAEGIHRQVINLFNKKKAMISKIMISIQSYYHLKLT